MSVREAMKKIDDEELKYWMAFNRTNPFSYERFDVLAGMIAMSIQQPHLKEGATVKISDYIPDWGSKKEGMSGKQMENAFRSFAALHNKRLG